MASQTSQLVVRLRDEVSGPAGKAARSLRGLQNEAKGSSLGGVASRAFAPLVNPATLGIGAVAFGIKHVTQEALSLERTMTLVGKATNASGADLKAYETQVLDLSRATGKSKEEIGGILAAAAFAGRPVKDLAQFTEYASQATGAWGTNAEETGQALAELGNIFRADQARLQEIGDAINHVADNAAAGEKDLLEFLRRSGAVGAQAGLTAEQTLAFGAALKEIGTPTEVAATGFNALMNAMMLGEDVSANAEKGFKKLGLNAKAMQKAFVAKPLETTLGLLEKINSVKDPLKRASIVTDIFGKEYGDDIARLTGNMDGLRRSVGLVADKTKYAGSVARNFQDSINTDVGRIERAGAALDVLAVRTGNAFKVIAGSVAEEINKFVDATEKGDTSVQRLLIYYNELLGRKGGEIETPGPELQKWAEDTFGQYTPRALFDSYFGKTGDEAKLKGQQAAIANEVARENAILERESNAKSAGDEARRRLTERPLLPSEQRRFQLEANRADDELRAAQREADEVRRKRAELPGSVAQLERQLRAKDNLIRLGQGPSDDLHGPGGTGQGVFALTKSGHAPPPQGVDTTGLDTAKGKATDAGSAIQALASPVSLNVDASQLDATLAKARALNAELERIAGNASRATAAAQGSTSRNFGLDYQSRLDGSFADWEP